MIVYFMIVSLIQWLGYTVIDDKAVFVFVGDVNAHHSEWLHGVCLYY